MCSVSVSGGPGSAFEDLPESKEVNPRKVVNWVPNVDYYMHATIPNYFHFKLLHLQDKQYGIHNSLKTS